MITEQINKIKELKIQIEAFLEEIKVTILNKEIPLEERWKLYRTMSRENIITEYDGYGPDLRQLDKMGIDSPYDYLYCEKYESKDYTDIMETIEDHVGSDCEWDRHWKSIDLSPEAIDLLKEEILTRFPERGFTYDW